MDEKARIQALAKELIPGQKLWVTIIDLKTRRILSYKPGELKSHGITKEYATVKFDDGSRIETEGTEPNTFHLSQIELRTTTKVIVEDLISLEYINEPEIEKALKNRYDAGETFAYCGETLISMNPYEPFPQLYTVEKKRSYKKSLESSFYVMQKLHPHIYSIALAALHEVIYDERPERKVSLCLSGESGGGKTTGALNAVDFLMFCFNEQPEAGSLEARVLQSNRMLEAFGNAQTSNNDNSSRFSKYVQLYIDTQNLKIVGYELKTYLLEKTLLVNTLPEDRKFHVFYALMKHMPSETKAKYHFKSDFSQYSYLVNTLKSTSTNSDKQTYDNIFGSFETFGYSQEEQDALFTLISAILLIGNLAFKPEAEKGAEAKFDQNEDFNAVCQLFKCSASQLETEFVRKYLGRPAEDNFKSLTTVECVLRKDVLAKCLYDALFEWIENKQSEKSRIEKKTKYHTLGVLDISGFEVLAWNSLEQLAINYCNERTQKLFIGSYFEQEKALFDKEGLSKYVSEYQLTTNEDVIRAIDNPKNQPKGIFQVLDEVVKSNRSDGGFIVSVTESLKNCPVYEKSKVKNDKFKIEHSNYTVEYVVKDFVEKAKDELPSNILSLICKSNPLLAKILAKKETESIDNTKAFNFVDNFKAGMNSLLQDLERSRCYFARCVKPNVHKQAKTWDTELVFNQIKCMGIKDYLVMKKKLYPLRIDYKEFCKKYLELNFDINELFPELEAKASTDFKEIAKKTYLKVYPQIKEDQILLGKKKMFAHYYSLDLMDEKLKTLFDFINSQRTRIIKHVQMYWLRKNWVVFIENLKRSMTVARTLFGCWLYKVKDYQRFKKVLKIIRRTQVSYRFMMVRRATRAFIQRQKFEASVGETLYRRVAFLKQKQASLVIQRAYVVTQFKKLVNGRMAIRKMIYEEYYGRFWEAILVIIQTKASHQIQNIFRGYLAREQNSYKVARLEEFKRNYRLNLAATKITAFFKANYVRQRIRKLAKASVKIQKRFRMRIHRRAYLILKDATIVIQRFLRRIQFKKNRYDFLLDEKLSTGEFARWEDLCTKERSTIFSVNFVNSIKPSDRLNKLHKKSCNMSFVPEMKPYTLKKLKIYSYILDVDPIVDPKDTYNSLWSIPFLAFLRKSREEYGSNLLGLTVGESHSIAYTDNLRFYNWGGSNMFQLGIFESFSKTYPKEADMSIDMKSANYMMAGNNHTLMYSSNQGKLYSWGDNSYGQLGLGHFSTIKGIVDISHLLKHKEAKQIDAKADINVLLLEDGSASVWPFDNTYVPDPSPVDVKFKNDKIATVAAGFDFVLFATETGRLFTMGKSNSCGELGHGDFSPRLEPTLVESLANSGDMAVQISCGFKHCIMRNQNGKIFTWGWGERGQLGHDNDRNLPFPRKLLFRNSGGYSYQALNIQAGYRCSYALLEERRIFIWGTNGRYTKVLTPSEYQDFGEDEIYFKKADFRPLKICTTWSKSLSITYMMVGDVRYLDNLKFPEREVLLKQIYNQWEQNYYDCKPLFDKKTGVYLDSNIMCHQLEKIKRSKPETEKKTTKFGNAVSKSPMPARNNNKISVMDLLKKKAEQEKSVQARAVSKEKMLILKNLEKIDKEIAKADTRTVSEKENSFSRMTVESSKLSRMKTPVKEYRQKTPPPQAASQTDKLIKEKYSKVHKEMVRILAKNPKEWTLKEKQFVDEAKRMFKE